MDETDASYIWKSRRMKEIRERVRGACKAARLLSLTRIQKRTLFDLHLSVRNATRNSSEIQMFLEGAAVGAEEK